ncbi:MAG: hypothetical protein PHU06_00740 [Gallionella sp.]|nr:hypothetical protein [Gallionella sp.]MDD4957729.1 hypothetical protein [Gallionella sp.]
MNAHFSCSAIFCDDIRQELHGKMSLMGIYNGSMYVPVFPIVLPKICAFFELRISSDFRADADAVLTVMKGAERINSITIPLSPFDSTIELPHGKTAVAFSRIGAMEFPAMTFDEPTLIEVVVQLDGQSMVAGRLWVTTFPQADET